MQEIVPYQQKRGKVFPENTTPETAILSDLIRLLSPQDEQTTALLATLASKIALLVSQVYVLNPDILWTTNRLTEPLDVLLALESLFKEQNRKFPTRRYQYLPATYRKALKKTLTKETTLESLSITLQSKRKAKRTLRILHKRYGIYTSKKPKFSKKA